MYFIISSDPNKSKMKCVAFSLSLLTVVAAKPGWQFLPSGHKFQAQDEGSSVRIPCPAINTLANHGFITRDGNDVVVDDLAQALEDIYRISGKFLIDAPIASAIRLDLTVEDEGDNFLSIDRLFEAPDAQEHDSSFIREDSDRDPDNAAHPSPHLIKSFLDSTNRAILKPDEIMEYQSAGGSRNFVKGTRWNISRVTGVEWRFREPYFLPSPRLKDLISITLTKPIST